MDIQAPLKIYLLRQQPLITYCDEPINFGGQPLELFIYITEAQNAIYSRTDLLTRLYGTHADPKTLRKSALFYLPSLIKELCLDTSDQSVIKFDPTSVWVDSVDFMQRTNLLLTQSPLTHHQQIQEAQNILDVYRHHFLQDYFPKADGLVNWREKRQLELVKLRHNLFDQIIQFYLWHASLIEAQQYAEQWLASIEPGYIPLQYLIWVTANRGQNAQLVNYLDMLRKKERKEKTISPIGLSASAWRRHIQKHSYLPLSLLRLTTSQLNRTFSEIDQDEVIGQENTLHEVLVALSEKHNKQRLSLTGLPGVGKTTLAQLVAQVLRKPNSGYEVIQIQLKPEPDFESILNDILKQFRMDHLLSSNYVKKQRQVKQILRQRRTLIIVDEGNTRKLGDVTVYQTLLNTLGDASLLLVAQQLPDDTFYNITVQGLKPKHAQQMLIHSLPKLSGLDESVFQKLVQITGGLPLGLKMLAGFLIEGRFQLATFVEALYRIAPPMLDSQKVYEVYQNILAWLWRTLTAMEKLILYAVSMFDSTSGATAEDIVIVCPDFRADTVRAKIETLNQLGLLRLPADPAQTPHYTLHSVVHNFVRSWAFQELSGDVNKIERAYISYFSSYIKANVENFSLLDQQKENIIHILHIVLLNEKAGREDFLNAVIDLCHICPYLEKRGLYEVADKLISQVLQTDVTRLTTEYHVRLLHFAGQMAYKQSNYDSSAQYLEQALTLARNTNAAEYYSAIYLDLGLFHLQAGDYTEAMNFFETANEWALRHEQLLLLCRIAANSGVCANKQGYYDLGRRYFEQVWEYVQDEDIHTLSDNVKDILQFSLNGLGLAFSEAGDYVQAEHYYQQALELAREVNNPERLGYLYVNLGVANFFSKAYDAAQEYFVQGKIIADYIQHDDLSTLIMWNQGALNSAQQNYETAAGLLKTALIRAQEMGSPWMQTGIYIVLGKLYFRQEVYQKAQQCFLKALESAGQNVKFLAQIFYGLGIIEVATHDIIGTDDPQRAAELISKMLTVLNVDLSRLCQVSYAELEKAHKLFQHDVEGYPYMDRFRVVEGLWASRPSLPPI
jgi:tetratricopeptide (TPR) repeat protein